MSKDNVIETRICKVSGKEFTITQQDADFYKKVSQKFGEYIAEVPFPTLCPEERQRRRFAFRNERKLYRRECDATQRQIISMYRPDSEHIVYDQKVWWSDEWDAMDYGRDFDFSKTFTQQFDELMKVVPRVNLLNDYERLKKSSYVNLCGSAENCYLIFEAEQNKNCSYSYIIRGCNDCHDCTQIDDSSSCYECVYVKNCYGCFFSYKLVNCTNMFLCEDSFGSSDCFMSTNLNNQKYMIMNKQYTKNEYEITTEQYKKKYSITELKEYFERYKGSYGYIRSYEGLGNENITGNLSKNCRNCISANYCTNIEDCGYVSLLRDSKDCYDYDARGENSSLMYEVHNGGRNCHRILFSSFCRGDSSNIYYSSLCPLGNKNLFGCVGLRGKEYCIFNKQYTKENYETLVVKIIEYMKTTGERGEFFDPSISLFAYNETVAQEYYPISQSKAIEQGFNWTTYQVPLPKSGNIKKGGELSDRIEEVDNDVLHAAIECEVTGKLFRIQPSELVFYRKYGIPVPSKHPDQRHMERLALRKGSSYT